MSDEGFEREYIDKAFDTNWISPLGENVDEFENEIIKLTSGGNALALSSGTAAIHLALKTVNVQQGDIVFVQTLTFSATVNPIIYENAIPVFIDSAPGTWNMDPRALEKAFLKYTPKAVIVVHLYGLPAEIEEIREICKKHNTPLIEDAAESLGSTVKGRWTGTFGDLGIFSFNGNKIITTSGGGMLISQDKAKIDKARFWSTQSREAFRHYEHKEVGYNYRLSNVLAGIGRGQLKVLSKRVEKKRLIFHAYQKGLKDIKEISFINEKDNEHANYWLSAMIINSDKITPNMVIEALEKENIESRPIWKPMHLQPIFKKYDFIGNGVAEELFEKGLCLPSDSKMTDAQVQRVINLIRKLWE
ncbi:aminotransferase class I/II-fold pyridoxal phosphate-dependent enzyme [Tuanshanicoccus yangjingiae]|uniref:aminotransferase class I/II-fold pyridoxal phosphate-dependent enzyme n=1 Tax=Aerococcaceae bacterium zg-252 TaxID=2796928 RepID=UPI004064C36E